MAGFYESLNKQNYLKAMSGAYQNYGITPDSLNSVSNNGGAISATISLADNIKNAQATADRALSGENHDSDPNWWSKTMNVLDNIYNNIWEGIFNFADAIGDFGMGIVGGIAGAVGNKGLENNMKKAINTDWQANATQFANAAKKTLDWTNYLPNSGVNIGEQWNAIGSSEASREQLNKVKYGNDLAKSSVGKGVIDFLSNVAQGLGEMIPSLGLGKIVGVIGKATGAATAAQRTANIVTQASLGFVSGAGKGYSTVAKEDGSLAKGSGYAAVKGLISGATRAGSAAFGGSYSDKAMNKVGVKTAEAILGHGGSEKLAKVVSSITSVATDAAIEGGVDFVTSLADPVLKQIYDDKAIEKAYGDDRWKETLANAGMTALTSALTTAITDSFKLVGDNVGQKEAREELARKREQLLTEGLSDKDKAKIQSDINNLEQNIHDTQSEKNIKEARDNNAVKRQDAEINRATKDMETNGETEKLDAMKDLQRRAKANEQVVLDAQKETEKAYEKQGDVLRKLLSEGLDMEAVQKNRDYIDATNDVNAKVEEMKAAAQKSAETSQEILDQAVEYNAINKQAQESASEGNPNKPYDNPNVELTEKANVRDRKIVEKFQHKVSKTGNEYDRYVDLGNGISAKVDANGKLVYHADSLDSTVFLMTQQDSDDKTGRVVRIDREYTGNTTELKVDTSTVGIDEINGFARTLESDNTKNTAYYNKATKETYIENDGGSRFMFKNGVYQGMVTARPDWATQQNIETWKSRSSLADNNMNLIKQASEIGYITEKDAVDSVDSILNSDSIMGGNKGAEGTAKKEGWFRRLSTAYALSPEEDTRVKAINGAYQELKESVEKNGGAMPMDEKDFTAVVKDYLDEVQKHTSNQKKIANLKDALAETNARNEEIRFEMDTAFRTKLGKLTQEIRNIRDYNRILNSTERAYNALNNKIKREGTADAFNKPYEKMNGYVRQYKQLKFSKSKGGIDPESIRNVFIDGVDTIDDDGKPTKWILDYDQNSLEDAGLGYLYDHDMEQKINQIKSHFKNGQYMAQDKDGNWVTSDRLSMDDANTMTAILNRVNRMTNTSDLRAKTDRKMKYMPVILATEGLKDGNPTRSGVGMKAQKMLNSTLGMPERMRILLGEGSPAYNLLVTNVQQDWLNAKYQKKQITDDMNRMIEKYGIKQEEVSAKDIKYTQIDGSESTLKKGQAMELYLQSLSPDNFEKLKNDGFTTKMPGRTQKIQHYSINEQIMDQISAQLTKEEKDFCIDLFQNGYNGLTKSVLNKYTTKKFGYSQFIEQNYVNRTMETDQANIDFKDPKTLFSASDATAKTLQGDKGEGIGKARNGNRNAMTINDIFQHYDSYADSVAKFVSLDNVREMDIAMNMRGSQTKFEKKNYDTGEKEQVRGFAPTSIYANFSQIEGGKQLIENWLKVANGLSANGNSGSIPKILNNAVATPIGLNPGTYLKMYLDPLRLIGKEIAVTDQETGEVKYKKITWGNFFMGLLNSFNARTRAKNSTDTFTTVQSGSKYYAAANMDNYAVNSNVFGANMNKFTRTFSKPLESANNAMMSHIVFPTLQAFAQANGYGSIGDDMNTMEALNLFDSVSVTALSNGDALDVSDLRAGRNGALLKSVFGLYGGDSQKKMEQISEVFLGNARSKRRVAGMQKIIDKYEGNNGNASVIDEYRQREEEAKKNYEKWVDKRDSLGEEEDPSKYDFNILMAKDKWDSAKMQTQSVIDSVAQMKERIQFEQEHVQDKKNNVAKAGYVMSAFAVACAIEGGINVLVSKMKDKDEEVTLASYGQDLGSSMLVDWIPYIGTIASAFKYSQNGFTPLQFQGLQEAITAFKSVANAAQDPTDGNKWNKAVLNMLNTIGYSFGIPVKNFIDYTSGAIGNIDNMTGNKMTWVAKTNTLLKGYNSSTLKTKATNYAKAGNLSKATEYTQANMAFYKAGAVDWNTAREIARTGATVRDRPVGTQSDTDKFMNVYTKANASAQRYMRSSTYNRLSDNDKGKALTKIYNAYYDVASAITNQDEEKLTTKLSKILYLYFTGKTLTGEQKQVLREYKII